MFRKILLTQKAIYIIIIGLFLFEITSPLSKSIVKPSFKTKNITPQSNINNNFKSKSKNSISQLTKKKENTKLKNGFDEGAQESNKNTNFKSESNNSTSQSTEIKENTKFKNGADKGAEESYKPEERLIIEYLRSNSDKSYSRQIREIRRLLKKNNYDYTKDEIKEIYEPMNLNK